MQLTRQQIIDYLQINRIATSVELSGALQVTSANIRHHLKLLEAANLVEVVGTQPVRGRGRPMKVFSLTENSLHHNLKGLSKALLKTLFDNSIAPSERIAKVAENLIGEFEGAPNIHSRLNQAVEHLNNLQYQASWEASPRGPRMIFRNCPYTGIIAEHPELCKMDEALLTFLLDQSIDQTAKLERNPDGTPHCAFVTQHSD